MFLKRTGQWRAVVALAICVVVAYFAYLPAQQGGFQFDDAANLKGLADIANVEDAKAFVLTGKASNVGRPLAMASFLLQMPSWPTAPGDFIRANILIHLINGLLLFMVAYRASLAAGLSDNRALSVGVATAGTWLLHPLLASASLFVIQRMTTLAATFTFLGLWLYLLVRPQWISHPKRTALFCALILGGSTLLALGCKENGVLLPAYCLVVEILLIRDGDMLNQPLFRSWLWVVCVLPLVGTLVYLAWSLPSFLTAYVYRDFSVAERLATEPLVHLDYLRWLLIPTNAFLGPFHDDYPIVTWRDGGFWLVMAMWAGIAGAAWLLRRRSLLPFFALSWFLVGHLLEGTIIPLELVFEHRNYIPSVGPILAATFMVVRAMPARMAKPVIGLFSVYLLVLAVVLQQVAATWGTPSVAARVWFERHPASERATQFLAGDLVKSGQIEGAFRLLDQQARQYPSHISFSFHALYAGCFLGHQSDIEAIRQRVQRAIPLGSFSYGVLHTLRQILWLIQDKPCPGLRYADLLELSKAVESNPKYRRSLSTLWEIQAEILAADGRLDEAVSLLRGALDRSVGTSLLERLISLELQFGRFTDALADIERYRGGLQGVAGQLLAERLDGFRSELERSGDAQAK